MNDSISLHFLASAISPLFCLAEAHIPALSHSDTPLSLSLECFFPPCSFTSISSPSIIQSGPLLYPLFLLCFLKSLTVFLLSPAVLHSCFSREGGGQGRGREKRGRGNLSFREGGWGKRGKEGPFLYENAFCWECWEENPSMTKAVGPKHKPDLWKVRAKSQVFSTAGLSAPLSFSISFLSFMVPPSCLPPSPALVSPCLL